MKKEQSFLKNLLNPPEEYSPIPFWFFNDRIDETVLEKQFSDYVEKGVNGIVLHPRIGIPKDIPYLSEVFFEEIKKIVHTAHKHQMKVVLYDEGMYPSGSAHGQVVESNPAFASKGICLTEDVKEGDEVIVKINDHKSMVYRYTKGTIRGIHFGEDDGEAGAPLSADILNPEAVDCFIKLTHKRYYEELSEYFGHTIIGFFTDEPCAVGRISGFYGWLPGLEKEICAEGGRLEELEALFCKQRNATTDIYHKKIKFYLRNNFYGKLHDWCEAHGICLMGHPEVSDDVEEELYFHIPGQDLIARKVSPETGGIREFDSVQAKLSADIARGLGRRRNSNECFGVCSRKNRKGEVIPWYFTGGDMKWYINWLGIRGVNLFIPHAFYYSVQGGRGAERPPDVGEHNIWWPHYRTISDYIKRISYLMTDSVNHAKIAVICDNNHVPGEEIAELYENQIEFNYLPVSMIGNQAKVVGNKIEAEAYSYEYVINLPDHKIDEALGSVPVYHSTEEFLEQHREEFSYIYENVPDCRITKLEKDGLKMYLISNEGENHVKASLKEKCTGNLIEVQLWEGRYSTIECEEQTVEVELSPHEMKLSIYDEEKQLPYRTREAEEYLGDWTGFFQLTKEAVNQKEYEYLFECTHPERNESFSVTGEELAECYCNGKFAGFSLSGPHKFLIGEYLTTGKNRIRLIFKGNAANIYENAEIPYGLNVQNPVW